MLMLVNIIVWVYKDMNDVVYVCILHARCLVDCVVKFYVVLVYTYTALIYIM